MKAATCKFTELLRTSEWRATCRRPDDSVELLEMVIVSAELGTTRLTFPIGRGFHRLISRTLSFFTTFYNPHGSSVLRAHLAALCKFLPHLPGLQKGSSEGPFTGSYLQR